MAELHRKEKLEKRQQKVEGLETVRLDEKC